MNPSRELPIRAMPGAPREDVPSYIKWFYFQTTSNIALINCTLGGPLFSLYLGTLGLDAARIGMVVSLFPFMQVLALVSGGLVERMGFCRAFVIFHGVRKFFVIALAAAPWVLTMWGPAVAFGFVAACVAAFGILRSLGETAIYPWMKEFIPDECRGRVLGTAVVWSAITTVAGMLLLSGLVHQGAKWGWRPAAPFQLAFVVLPLLALCGVMGTTKLPGGHSPRRHKPLAIFFCGLKRALRDANFRRFLLGDAMIVGISALFVGLMPVYLLTVAAFDSAQILLLGIAQMAGAVCSGYFNGRAVDRLGSRRVLLRILAGFSLLPALWLALPGLGRWSIPAAYLVYFLFGFVYNGAAIAVVRILYNGIVPQKRKTEYLAVRYAVSGALAGFFPLLGGLSVCWMDSASKHGVCSYLPAFLACMLASLGGVIVFRGVGGGDAAR